MIKVVIQNTDRVIQNFRGIHDDQLPFAMARSLTGIAKQAQDSVQTALPARFTIRRLAWARGGIRVEAATKRDLFAVVKDIHSYMQLQEEGGTKLPQFGRFLAVPLSGARRSVTAIVDKADLPGAVMASGLGFIRGNVMYRANFVRSSSRRGFRGVKGFNSGSWSRKIIPMYALVPKASVPARYGFVDIVKKVVGRRWEQEFAQAFAKAVETSK